MKNYILAFFIVSTFQLVKSQNPRARDLGIPFVGITGQFNAITDVKGVEVGYSTIIEGDGKILLVKVLLEQELPQYFQEERRINLVLCMPIGTA